MDAGAINELHAFLEHYPTKAFSKGEIIIFQGEAPRSGYIVKQGVVKAYNLSVDGNEKPVDFYSANSIFPGTWVYGKTPSAIYYYEAFTAKVLVAAVPREEYVRFIKSKPQLLFMELDHYLIDELGQSMRLNALEHSRASEKLLYTLHYLALSHGETIAPQKKKITLELTHQDFANLTGLTRETAATELNKLKHSGVIDYGKGKPYVLDVGRLMSLLNDQYISDLQIKMR